MDEPRLLRMIPPKELGRYTGDLKRSAIDDLIRRGEFPKPVRLSERRKAWRETDLINWQQAKFVAASREQDEGGS